MSAPPTAVGAVREIMRANLRMQYTGRNWMLRPSTILPRAWGPSSWQAIRASRRAEGGSHVGKV